MPYLLREVGTGAEVWGTRLTLGMVKSKLDEHGLLAHTELVEIDTEGGAVEVGPFRAEFVRVTHSVPDAVAVILHTDHGAIVHTGDFKLDETPVDGRVTDLARLSALGDEGVALLMADSTNAERPGHTPSERTVGRIAARDRPRRARAGDRDVVLVAHPPPAAGDRRRPGVRAHGVRDRALDDSQHQHRP